MDKIIALLIIVLAIDGLIHYIRRSKQNSCDGKCEGCRVSRGCKKAVSVFVLAVLSLSLSAQDTLRVSGSDFQIQEVNVSASRKTTTRNRFSPYDSQRIDSKELCKAACCNLSESFETNASVDVAYADAATGAKTIRLLGLSGTYVQLLGENCPAVRGLAQTFGMEYIPGPWMESIQVSKGTSSVVNGYEAITGQINVEYLKPQKQDPIAINAMLSSELHAEVNLTGGWDVMKKRDAYGGTLSTGVLAHYQIGRFPMDDNRDGFLDMPMNQNLNILNRWYYQNERYTFQLLVRGLHDDRQGGQRDAYHHFRRSGLTLPENPYRINLNTDRIDGFMKNGIVFDPETGMSLGIITAASYHKQNNIYGDRTWDADQWNAYANVLFQNTWCDESQDADMDHKLTAGASLNYDRYGETLMGADLGRQETTPGIFAEYTFKYEQMLSLVAGIRGDYSTRYGLFCTPRLNIRYAPWEWWTIRGSVGLGYRSPNLVADNANCLPSARTWTDRTGTKTLDVFRAQDGIHQERSLNAGATISWDIPMGNKTMQLSVEYYYTHFFEALIADRDADRGQVRFYNLTDVDGRSRSHNAQIEASMEILRGWTMTAAFRYTDVRQTSYNAAAGEYQLRERALQSRYKGVLTTSYVTPLKKWQFDVTAQVNGGGRMPDGFGNFPVYPQLMAQVTKYWRTCSLYVGAENMTNFTQANPVIGAEVIDREIQPLRDDFDASMVWGPTTGWKVYVGFRWALSRPDED